MMEDKQDSCEHTVQIDGDSRQWAVLHNEGTVAAYDYSPDRLGCWETLHREGYKT